MILITGASGKTGNAIIKSLSNTESICAFVHREASIAPLRSLSVKNIIVGELSDETAIRSAMQGMRAVYHVCPNMSPDEIQIGGTIISEAKKADVEHFVYHSVLHPQTGKMAHHWAKLRVEELLFESGLPFTILQPAPYMQNLLAGWKIIVEESTLRVPYSVNAKFSFIDLEDLAEAARTALTETIHINATYELAGTFPTSHVDAAKILGRVLGKDIHAEVEEISTWKARTGGLSEYALENLVRMFEYYNQWGLTGNPSVLRWVLKREPTSLEQFIESITKERTSPL